MDDARPEPLLLTVDDLAALLGVSAKTVRRLDLEGRLPQPIRIGRSLRWRRDEIVRWIEAGAPRRKDWNQRK